MPDLTRREMTAAVASLIGMSAGMPTLAAAQTISLPTADQLRGLNPELLPAVQRFIELMRSAASNPSDAMKRLAAQSTPLPDVAWRLEHTPGRNGAPDVPLYVINAKPGQLRPAILHTHGGGFVGGSAKDAVVGMQRLAKTLDCVVVSVDYRLAPATTWRGSVEDNYAGLKWLHTNAAALGADRNKIAVMGESAGGGHAALLAIIARDRGEVPLIFQSLMYPMLDDRTGSSRAVPSHIGRIGWTTVQNRQGWKAFLGIPPGGADVPVAAVPARTKSLAGLPPAFIGVGSIDLFVDEDIEYARRLVSQGVPTELEVIPGGCHGFDALPEGVGLRASISDQFNNAKLNALRRAFGQKAVTIQ